LFIGVAVLASIMGSGATAGRGAAVHAAPQTDPTNELAYIAASISTVRVLSSLPGQGCWRGCWWRFEGGRGALKRFGSCFA
jgi:hypothetical protein